ncbi:hypothetical protein DFH09DRAFT_1318341 [Mycena vulgaris]|nr:hypothetical protein DFH09DRAFT_1318341 [Mycena vulgaris]
MKRFPAELEDTLIDFCHGDHATLASCGLVCRDWLPASRYHIFSSVRLTPQNAAGFVDITSSSPTIAPSVREADLHFSETSLPNLIPILKLLPRMARLSLHPLREEVTRPITTSSLSPIFAASRLVDLKLDFRSRFESLRQIVDCVCLCQHLESLELGGSWLKGGDFEAAPQLPKTLHTLTLTCDLNILSWLLTLDEMPAIQHLFLHHIVQREVAAIVQFLQTSGPTLNSLGLAFRDNDAQIQFAAQVDLAHNSNLHNFKMEGTAPGILHSLPGLLPQLHRCRAECITISVLHRHPGTSTYPWAAMDPVLSDPQLRFLKCVTLCVIEPLARVQQPQMVAHILGQLPLTAARGIVVV